MRGGDRDGDGYGPSGVGSNKGPGATSGGIGNTGVGWSGPGHQSRASAASRGARGIGGGGYGGSRRGSVGAGRRSDALEAFGLKDALSTLGLSGLGLEGMTELGEVGWSGPGHKSRDQAAHKGLNRGALAATNIAGMKATGSVMGAEDVASAVGQAASLGMTPDERRGYQDVQSKTTGLAPAIGLTKGTSPMAYGLNVAVNIADYGLQSQYAKEQYGVSTPQRDRRSDALNAFAGKSQSQSQPAGGLLSNPNPAAFMWEPASYGVGEYGSHSKKLIS